MNGVRRSSLKSRVAERTALKTYATILLAGLLMMTSVCVIPSGTSAAPSAVLVIVPDDYATIEEAYAHVDEGGTILVRSGTYDITLTVFKNVTIRSESGPLTTTLVPRLTGGFAMIYLNSPARISGFTVQAPLTPFVNVEPGVGWANVSDNIIHEAHLEAKGSNFIFFNNTIAGGSFYPASIYVRGQHSLVAWNQFTSNSELQLLGDDQKGLHNAFTNSTVRIAGNRNLFDGNLMQKTVNQALFSNGQNTTISNNSFSEIGWRAIDSYATNDLISDNRIWSSDIGIYLTSNGHGARVLRNNITSTTDPIELHSRYGDVLKDNELWDNNPGHESGTDHGGIYIANSRGIQVLDNSIVKSWGSGIYLNASASLCQGNNISFIGYSSNSAMAIWVSGSDDQLLRNRVWNSSGNGMTVYGSRHLVDNNTVSKAAWRGIFTSSSSDVLFTYNDLIDNGVNAYDDRTTNRWNLNLFSDYFGPDANKDGIGDLPYNIPGGLNQDLHPRILHASEVGELNLGILPIRILDSPGFNLVYYDEAYYEKIGTKLQEYFDEVSYGAIKVSVQVLFKKDGTMFDLPYTAAGIKAASNHTVLWNIARIADPEIDFRAYDYDPAGGKGIIAAILPFAWRGSSSFIFSQNGPNGWYDNDSASMDMIYTFNQRFNGDKYYIRALAHEYGHFLGKDLVTSITKAAKDSSWVMPDEYLMGNLTMRNSLMGDRIDVVTEHVHPDAYTKEWLGWLKYANMTLNQTYVVFALSLMGLGDEVYRYPYKIATEGGGNKQGFYTFELRTNDDNLSSWDNETLGVKTLQINEVNIITNARDKINQYRQLNETGAVAIVPDLGVQFRAVSVNKTFANVVAEPYMVLDMVGASLIPSDPAIDDILDELDHDYGGYAILPDTDLHAYSEDGKHVGMNYVTGQYEVDIPGAISSGDSFNGHEWIFVPEEAGVVFNVTSQDTQEFLSQNPQFTDMIEDVENVMVGMTYYSPSGERLSSLFGSRPIQMGQEYSIPFSIVQDEDGSYTIGLTDAPVLYTVSFVAQGLPAGTIWSVTVDGVMHSSTTSTIELQLESGIHSYAIGGVTGYSSSPVQGSVYGGEDLEIQVSFTANEGGQPIPTDLLIVAAIVLLLIIVVFAVAMRRKKEKR